MISRIEFYTGFFILCGFIIFWIWSTDHSFADIQKAKLEVKDSILQVQRDSAVARALKFELKSDSLQSVVNRKKLDIQIIHKKYETEKKTVLVLGADSSLALFTRTITH